MATKRRASGEGSYYQQDGRWKGRAHVKLATGEKVRVCVSGASRDEVVERLRIKLAEVEAGVVKATRGTVADLLATWLEANRTIRPTTRAYYELCLRKIAAGSIGGIKATDLTGLQIDAFLAGLEETESARSRQMLFGTLRTCYRWAVKKGLVARNPVDRADLVKVAKTEMKTWSRAEVTTFLASLDDNDPYAALWQLALATGMRQGEMLGLRWADVDFSQRTVRISGTLIEVEGEVLGLGPTKSACGVRVVSIHDGCVRALLRHRERLMAAGLAANEKVFPAEDGGWLQKYVIRRAFLRATKKAGLPVIRFHDLRHTHATILAEAGVSPKTLQTRLGHSSVVMTLERYIHATDEADRLAAATFAESV